MGNIFRKPVFKVFDFALYFWFPIHPYLKFRFKMLAAPRTYGASLRNLRDTARFSGRSSSKRWACRALSIHTTVFTVDKSAFPCGVELLLGQPEGLDPHEAAAPHIHPLGQRPPKVDLQHRHQSCCCCCCHCSPYFGENNMGSGCKQDSNFTWGTST